MRAGEFELFLLPYPTASQLILMKLREASETRERKLLLHKSQIRKLYNKVKTQGYTVIPTKIYLVNGKAKIEIALAKGKTLYDKRASDKERSIKREIQKATRR